MAIKRRHRRSSKKVSKSPLILRIILTVLVLSVLGAVIALFLFSFRPSLSSNRAKEVVLLSFSLSGVPATAVRIEVNGNGQTVFSAKLKPLAAGRFQRILKEKLKKTDAVILGKDTGSRRIILLESGKKSWRIILYGAARKKRAEKITRRNFTKSPVPVKPAGKVKFRKMHRGEPLVAIILDDVGLGHMNAFRKALTIPYPLTFAIIPFRRYSRECASMARGSGFDMMVHMPMEPERYPMEDPGPGAIFEKDSRKLIDKKIQAAIDNIQYAVGMNNHMGSKATSIPFTMRVVMHKLKEKGLFFIDSRTTAESVALHEARRAGVPSLPRNVFLDNSRKEKDIRNQLQKVVKEACKNGYAVAIGHNYPETIDVLAAEMPLLDRKVNFVFVRELVNEAGKPD
ncbi:MAG: divergent polysaccharide deacetylase family protein [Acidobacteria bacterium]|nr:divergent polysaccharide deacetylase family protein [Acidobacteriota bacterium]